MPLHLLLGRTVAFKTFVWLARTRLDAARAGHENSFIKLARQGKIKHDDLLELVRVRRLRGQIADAGFSIVRRAPARDEDVPEPARPDRPLAARQPAEQDIVIGNIEYVLERRSVPSPDARPLSASRAPAAGAGRPAVIRPRRRCDGRAVLAPCPAEAIRRMPTSTVPPEDRARSTPVPRVFGDDMAEANRLRWDWQYRRNPNNPPDGPADLDRARRSRHHRPVRDDAGAACACRAPTSTRRGAWT